MYENVRQCTTIYDNVQHVATAYSTMYNNVRQKILPYDRVFVAPKSFTCKTFFKVRSIAYENLRLTANNHGTSRQHSNNYDFLIRTLSHLKIRMWESSITLPMRETNAGLPHTNSMCEHTRSQVYALSHELPIKFLIFFIREICTFNFYSIRHPTTACSIDVRLQHQMCDTVRFLSY